MTGHYHDRVNHLLASYPFLMIVDRFEELRRCPKSILRKTEDLSKVQTTLEGEAMMLVLARVQYLQDIEILFNSAPLQL